VTGVEESAIRLDSGLSAHGHGVQESGGVCIADDSLLICLFAQPGHVSEEFLLYDLPLTVLISDAQKDQALQGVLAFLRTDQH
jgi:hypothetical protein